MTNSSGSLVKSRACGLRSRQDDTCTHTHSDTDHTLYSSNLSEGVIEYARLSFTELKIIKTVKSEPGVKSLL